MENLQVHRSESEVNLEVGRIKHYYPKISVAVVDLALPLSIGDRIYIKGAHSNFQQVVDSMQIEHESFNRCIGGQSIGLKVAQRVHENDVVYKIL